MAVRRRYPVWWADQDFDDLWNELWRRSHGFGGPLLTAGGESERMLPARLGEFRVDVNEHDDEVIVVADLPGIEKTDVNLCLMDPKSLQISTERKDVTEEEKKGYYFRERVYGSMTRVIPLPADVTEKDADAQFTNGVLEVRLKKLKEQKGGKIEIK